jgi:hypothetical protein
VDVEPEVATAWARRWVGGSGAAGTWVVPQPRCGGTVAEDRACVARVDERGAVRLARCAGPRRIRERGAWAALRLPDRVVVTGFAPAGASEARIGAPGRGARWFAVIEGVFVAVPPEGASSGWRLSFR